MIASLFVGFSLFLPQTPDLPQPQQAKQAAHPLSKDKTGIRWVYPFKKALAQARKEKRLILMVPLAGGTDHTGNW